MSCNKLATAAKYHGMHDAE